MIAKCEIFITVTYIFIGIFKKQIYLQSKENLSDHRYERTDMGIKRKIFVTVTKQFTNTLCT